MFFISLSLATFANGVRPSQVELGSLNLVQTRVARCTDVGQNPLDRGVEVQCCPGLKQQNLNGVVSCQKIEVPCSQEGDDPHSSEIYLGCCPGLQECKLPLGRQGHSGHSFCSQSCVVPQEASCLCVFDIDRTLTAKQGSAAECPGTKELEIVDAAYGVGKATLSALAVAGIDKTFCKDCYLGICSAGYGSGVTSEWNQYILNTIMKTKLQDHLTEEFPFIKDWSLGPVDQVHPLLKSPYVLNQPQELKPLAVEGIRRWYEMMFNFTIPKAAVHFFDDRAENVELFSDLGIPAREVSCASRAGGGIGLCGALPDEILTFGPSLCDGKASANSSSR